MKDQHEEKWRAWATKADTLLEEIRACREYREIEDEMRGRIGEIFAEYMRLLSEGIKFLPVKEKLKIGLRVLRAKWDNIVFEFKWLLLKFGRLLLGLDV